VKFWAIFGPKLSGMYENPDCRGTNVFLCGYGILYEQISWLAMVIINLLLVWMYCGLISLTLRSVHYGNGTEWNVEVRRSKIV